MIKINENFLKLQGSYLFAEVNKRVREYQSKNPSAKVIRLGIGDVTEPLTPSVISGLREAVDEMSDREKFKGYSPDQGYDFLREAILKNDFAARGVSLKLDDIFISTGAKEDTANIQELFSSDSRLAIPDPVYPVYIDSNVMAGRSGDFSNGQYGKITYLSANTANQFKPELPKEPIDLIYLCFPNNPTGQVLNKTELKQWVDYAHKNKALILFDAAYEAFIREDGIPHSIYEIDGAKEVAIEFRSLSKTAGFTGTRCSYTVIPEEAMAYDRDGKAHSLNKLWLRRQTTKFNGTAYIIQKGAYAAFTEQGRKENKAVVDYYLGNAKIIAEGIASLGLKYSGGVNAPYIWFQVPNGLSSWVFFDLLLEKCQVVGTPGAGFGKSGEGYFRMSSFGRREAIIEAIERIKKHF
jgi:LL-diaminopimelate aminotransferase